MIRLTLPLTPLLNRYYRKYRNAMVISSEGVVYKQQVSIICHQSDIRPLLGAVSLTAHIYRARKAGDIDGYSKALLDCLQGYAYLNDNQIIELHMYRHDDKKNPRVEVDISELMEAKK